MPKWQCFILKNLMLLGNVLSNLLGLIIVEMSLWNSVIFPDQKITTLLEKIDDLLTPASILLILLCTALYEYPIRRLMGGMKSGIDLSADYILIAKKRLLNEPFFAGALNLFVWIFSACAYYLVFVITDTVSNDIIGIFLRIILIGLITSVVSFFVLEFLLSKWIVSLLYPDGKLLQTPGVLRINIHSRHIALLLAINIIPFIAIIVMLREVYSTGLIPENLVIHLQPALLGRIALFTGIGILVTALVSFSLTRPLKKTITVLKGVRLGQLDKRVKVTTSDEIGYTGDVINQMCEGLEKGEKMRQSLALAREIQLTLLPGAAPRWPGLDVAGSSMYCDQTGGDYFDYIQINNGHQNHYGLVLGDVSGHGIPSALVMTTARALIRQRASFGGSISEIMNDVNRQLCVDVEKSGQFMTLILLQVNPYENSLSWVRAGHEPGIRYNPSNGEMTQLIGKGIPLGVDPFWQYEESTMNDLQTGEIIILLTDGICESFNKEGEMFGREALDLIIKENANSDAHTILSVIQQALKEFRGEELRSDDETLIVIKVGEICN